MAVSLMLPGDARTIDPGLGGFRPKYCPACLCAAPPPPGSCCKCRGGSAISTVAPATKGSP
ncbi:conserved hypothetical protein [Ricinus communis]|uniref:Uncharacterized protein n=1 Tax=Ricinus communis TaxID=3988 RepID=B9RQA7_RICCO|nr:conserved hypothetical protein [Ricinus communis]